MFFREKRVKHTKLVQLVESYRDEEGRPRQRIVASLGDAALPTGSDRRIARCVQERLRGQRNLIEADLSADEAEWVDRIAKTAERTRSAQQDRGTVTLDGVVAERVDTVNKEHAMLSNAEKRFLADAEALSQRVDGGRLKDREKILKARRTEAKP